jgi:hypothetical protein
MRKIATQYMHVIKKKRRLPEYYSTPRYITTDRQNFNSILTFNFLTSQLYVLNFNFNIKFCNETRIVMKSVFMTANMDPH